jgi:hypothetical protein
MVYSGSNYINDFTNRFDGFFGENGYSVEGERDKNENKFEKKKRKEELGVLGKRCGKKRRGWKSEEGEEMESSEHMHFDFDNHSKLTAQLVSIW